MSQLRAPLFVPVFELHSFVGVSWCSVLPVPGDGSGLALGPASAAASHPSHAARGASRMMGMIGVPRSLARGNLPVGLRQYSGRSTHVHAVQSLVGSPHGPHPEIGCFVFFVVLPHVVLVDCHDSVRHSPSASFAYLPGNNTGFAEFVGCCFSVWMSRRDSVGHSSRHHLLLLTDEELTDKMRLAVFVSGHTYWAKVCSFASGMKVKKVEKEIAGFFAVG